MVGVTHAHDADAGRLRLLDGLVHGEDADKLPHARVAVYDGAHRGLENHFRLGIEVDLPLLDPLMVTDHALHAVALDAVQVGRKQHVVDLPALIIAEPERLEYVGAELLESLQAPFHICHRVPPFRLIEHGKCNASED